MSEPFANAVSGNSIGTDAAGAAGLGNGGDGIQIADGALLNQIGGLKNPKNVISGNAGNKVSISLTGGGIMDMIRAASGQGELLSLLGTISGKSTLTGTVTAGGTGNGTTTLTEIFGLAGVTDDLPAQFKITI